MFKYYNYLLGLLLGLVFIQKLAFGVGDLTAGEHAVTTTKGSRFETSSSVGDTTPIHFLTVPIRFRYTCAGTNTDSDTCMFLLFLFFLLL